MSMFLFIICIICYLSGFSAFLGAASAIHQILGAVVLVAGTVALGSAAIVERLDIVAKRLASEGEVKAPAREYDV